MSFIKKAKALITTRSIFTASAIIGMATLLSKATGFIRIQTIAAYFGASWQTDAFLTAFLIPECIYLFFTEGALSAALVPLFTEYFKDPEDEGAIERGQSLLSTLSIITGIAGLCIGLLIFVFRTETAWALGPQFSTDTRVLAAVLLGIISGYIPLGLIGGVYQGYLNSRGHFLAPSLGPLMFNIVTILSAVTLSKSMGIESLAWGVLAGGVLALVINMAALKLVGTKLLVKPDFRHEGLSHALRLLGPVIFSLFLVQGQVCTERVMASSLAEGSVSSLNFASKLLNLPAGLLALTTATAILPVLARKIASGETEDFIKKATSGHTVLMLAVAPLSLLLSVLSTEIVVLAFKRGAFSLHQAQVTGEVLFYYGLTLIPLTGTFLLTRIFFAADDTRTPAKIRVVTTTVNILFLSIFIERLGIIAVPAAFFAMYTLNYLALLVIFERRYPAQEVKMNTTLTTTVAATALGALAFFATRKAIVHFCHLNLSTFTPLQAGIFGGAVALGVMVPVYLLVVRYSKVSFMASLKELKDKS